VLADEVTAVQIACPLSPEVAVVAARLQRHAWPGGQVPGGLAREKRIRHMTIPLGSQELRAIARRFVLLGDFVKAYPYGSGHIHDTYAVIMNQGGIPVRYCLQRINHHVFKNPEAVQANIERITAHLWRKLTDIGRPVPSRRTLTLMRCREGRSFWQDPHGYYWRMYIFIERASTYDQIENTDQAYEAAKAFGEFVNLLSDLPERLVETIPDFHNTPVRFEALKTAIEADTHNRAANVKKEIDYALSQAGMVGTLVDLQARGLIPERTTHNDTKLNNVMLDDETGVGICVIDLDTAMPGLSLYDFGDMVRAAARPCAEDEQDLDKVVADLDMYKAIVRGYYGTLGEAMTPDEKGHMAFSAQLITFEVGIRFLTDYLQGDVYFKVHREHHNRDRSRAQFKMAREFERNLDEMQSFVDSL
jgi:hypothetical protein